MHHQMDDDLQADFSINRIDDAAIQNNKPAELSRTKLPVYNDNGTAISTTRGRLSF